jgi:tryptophan 7-halogenase
MTAYDADLPRRLIAGLGHPYGFERSIKLAPGELRADRYVASVHAGAFGNDLARALTACGGLMGMPDDLLARVPSAAHGCDVVHVGHERTARGPIAKIYFEYARAAHAAMACPDGAGTLVHRVFKWRVGAGDHAVSLYRWPGWRDVPQLVDSASALLPDPDARAVVRRALSAAQERGADAPPSLDVVDEGSARRSFDMMLYGAGLRVADVLPEVQQLCRSWHLRSAGPYLEDGICDQVLGHLSGGLSADGLPFLTVYFGATEQIAKHP